MERQVQNLAKLREHTSAQQILPTTSTSYQQEILKTVVNFIRPKLSCSKCEQMHEVDHVHMQIVQ